MYVPSLGIPADEKEKLTISRLWDGRKASIETHTSVVNVKPHDFFEDECVWD